MTKAVILAGGFGTRIAEESDFRPKPMIDIGGKPLLWHILKHYSHHGIDDFVICLGYMGYYIKEYFINYYLHNADVTIRLGRGSREIHEVNTEPWNVTLVDTGTETMTGGRLRRIRQYLDNEPFCMTYGDGLSDVDIGALLRFHRSHGRLATITAVQPPGRFGVLELNDDDRVVEFTEKPDDEIGWINGGFFVLDPKALDYVTGDDSVWEQEPLAQLSEDGALMAFRHRGFWRPCDTLRDKRYLESLWNGGRPPWRVWR